MPKKILTKEQKIRITWINWAIVFGAGILTGLLIVLILSLIDTFFIH